MQETSCSETLLLVKYHVLSLNMTEQSSEFQHDEEPAGGVGAGIYRWVRGKQYERFMLLILEG